MIVPDLQDGFMILQYDGDNRWCTGIECLLVRQAPGDADAQRAYLSHECRAERVCEDPYSHPGNYEYVGISTWSGNYALRSGPALVGVKSTDQSGRNRQDLSCEPTDSEFVVFCKEREARALSFEQVTRMLQTDFHEGYVKMYLALTFRRDENRYVLYTPCRYVNFPHPDLSTTSYLQPICGYVLYETDERFFLAYVVCYVENGRARSMQFRLRDKVTLGALLGQFKTDSDIAEAIEGIGLANEVVTSEFGPVERIDDSEMRCEFFCYV